MTLPLSRRAAKSNEMPFGKTLNSQGVKYLNRTKYQNLIQDKYKVAIPVLDF